MFILEEDNKSRERKDKSTKEKEMGLSLMGVGWKVALVICEIKMFLQKFWRKFKTFKNLSEKGL